MGFNWSKNGTDVLDPLGLSGHSATLANAQEQKDAAAEAVNQAQIYTDAALQAQQTAIAAQEKAQQTATDEDIKQAQIAAQQAEQYTIQANTSIEAAIKAGADTSNKQFQDAFNTIQTRLNPYIQSGQQATQRMNDLIGLNGPEAAKTALTTDPSYQFRLHQGEQAIERSAAAKGNVLSGRTGIALQQYGQDMASEEFTNAFNRLLTVSNQGVGATNSLNSYQQNLANNQSNNTWAVQNSIAQGAANLANTQTQGSKNIAGAKAGGAQNMANVKMQGAQNLANTQQQNALIMGNAKTGQAWQNANANMMQNNFAPNTAHALIGDVTNVVSAYKGGSQKPVDYPTSQANTMNYQPNTTMNYGSGYVNQQNTQGQQTQLPTAGYNSMNYQLPQYQYNQQAVYQ